MFKVSIHAPLARSKKAAFKSSPAAHVSIHAPLARSKRTGLEPRRTVPRFNTCSSCEEQLESVNLAVDVPFQYMLLLRGATGAAETVVYFGSRFQYMLLLRGATRRRSRRRCGFRFNTCSSCEEQQEESKIDRLLQCFNTCSSCEEQQDTPRS